MSIYRLTVALVVLCASPALANCRASWRLTTEESDRLGIVLQPTNCSSGQTEFVVSAPGGTFSAPCQFIAETTRHLREIMESHSPLAVEHAHIGVTAEVWDIKYRNMPAATALPVLLRDPALVAIYHSPCHDPMADHKTAGGRSPRDLNNRLNILGFYDGRPIAQLPYAKVGSPPQYYHLISWIYFNLRQSGEPAFFANGKSAPFDIHLEHQLADRDP